MRSFWPHLSWLAILSFQLPSSLASKGQDPEGQDLFSFVTRPDIQPPRLSIDTHDPNRVVPGYWFMSPYVDIAPEKPTKVFSAAQVGPHIYDGDGNLVWSGAPLVDQRTVFDFRVVEFDGEPYLSYILNHDTSGREYEAGAGFVLNNSYSTVATIQLNGGKERIDPHEFNVLNESATVLVIKFGAKQVNVADLGLDLDEAALFVNGIQEIDLETGNMLFNWDGAQHIAASESTVKPPDNLGKPGGFWDYCHMNSIEKTATGDYIFSARHLNGIYKVSKDDGSVIWRFGGKKSSFVLDGFNFSSQHDARVRYENETHTILSFFNNASDGVETTAQSSSAMLVSLDTSSSPMTATLIHRLERPDGKLSWARGNVQNLPNGNLLVGWGSHGYLTEFSPSGENLQETRFVSERFDDYRIYKFNFTGRPAVPPDVVARVYGPSDDAVLTVIYVSWNGATEVRSWRFYGAPCTLCPSKYIGRADKTGFETMYTATGMYRRVFVEAWDGNGNLLGKSEIQNATIPDTLAHVPDAPSARLKGSSLNSDSSVSNVSTPSVYAMLIGLTGLSAFGLIIFCLKSRYSRGYLPLVKSAD